MTYMDVAQLIHLLQGSDWLPPVPEVRATPYPTDSLNNRLDDLLAELNVLISGRPDDERRTINLQYVPEWAKKDLSAVLGCLDCELSKCSRGSLSNRSPSILVKQSIRSRTVDLTNSVEEHP